MHSPTLRATVWLAAASALLLVASACRSMIIPPADAVVEGRLIGASVDTTSELATIRVEQEQWLLRPQIARGTAFWDDIAALDVSSASSMARPFDQRTFALALRTLMAGDPEGATVAFRALHLHASDAAVRAGARVGLTMALSWRSDWPALANIGADPDSGEVTDSATAQATVERWGRALAIVPPPRLEIPDLPVHCPCGEARSALRWSR